MISFYELACFSKVYTAALGMCPCASISKAEFDIAFEVIKKLTDNRFDWTQEQKENYKLLVDFVKHGIEHS